MASITHNPMRGLSYSAAMHAIMVVVLIFGLPSFLRTPPEPEPMSVSVDILPIAPISNVKPQEKAPEKVEDKKPEEEKQTAPKAMQDTSKAEEKTEHTPAPQEKKDAVKIPDEKPKKPEEKKVKKDEELDNILKSVKNTVKAEEAKKTAQNKNTAKNNAISDRYDDSIPLSMSEKDAIRSQFQRCWNVPAGAKDAHNLIVTLRVEVAQDGSVLSAQLAQDTSRYNSDSFFRAAADSALRAVHRCSPLQNLSTEKYASWREMELTFNPRDMLY